MSPKSFPFVIAGLLFLGMFLCLELSYRIGRRSARTKGSAVTSAVEAAVFGLLGLMVAFSFAGASQRLTYRRNLIVEEANAIGTAYLRLDLLPAEDQPPLRNLFRRYLEARLQVYARLEDSAATTSAKMADAVRLQEEIWARSQAACRNDPRGTAAVLLLPALNQMIDITTTRAVALHTHASGILILLLCFLALLSAVLAGNLMATHGSRNALHILLFTVVISITIYAVIDMEYPRYGLIRIDTADEALRNLRHLMR